MNKILHFIFKLITKENNFECKKTDSFQFINKPLNDYHVYCIPKLRLDIVLGKK